MKVLQISKRGLPTEVMELGDISEPDAKAGGLGRRRHPVRDRRCPPYRARTKAVVGREPWSVAPQLPPGLFIFVRWD
jgi:hypothetical protein